MNKCHTIVKNWGDLIFPQRYQFYKIITNSVVCGSHRTCNTLQEWLLRKHYLFSLMHWWLTESGLQKHLSEVLSVHLNPFRMPLIRKLSHCIIKSVSRDRMHPADTLFNLCCYRKLLSLVLSNFKWKNKILSADKDKY